MSVAGTRAPGDESVRSRLLLAATEVFNRKGYAAASVREIVAAAGVTKPVLYYYFESKEGIYLAILEESHRVFSGVVDSVRLATGSARERLEGLVVTVFELFHANPAVVRLIHGAFYGPRRGAPPFDFDSFHEVYWNAIRGLVAEGIAGGELKPGDPDVFALALHGASNICMEVELAHPELSVGVGTLREVLRAVYDGLAAPSIRDN